MRNIHGVEFDEPVIESGRTAKTLDVQSPMEKWALANTKLSLRGLRFGLAAISLLLFIASAVFLFLTYYTYSPSR
ncbi:MAG: hypothetical protein WC763_00945 [Candidatus Paceibacterota bacterium]|jgi:hypothetical protein